MGLLQRAKALASRNSGKLRMVATATTGLAAYGFYSGVAMAAEVTDSGAIVITAAEKANVRNGLFQGVRNLVTLLMEFADILLLVAAAYGAFMWLKGLIQRR